MQTPKTLNFIGFSKLMAKSKKKSFKNAETPKTPTKKQLKRRRKNLNRKLRRKQALNKEKNPLLIKINPNNAIQRPNPIKQQNRTKKRKNPSKSVRFADNPTLCFYEFNAPPCLRSATRDSSHSIPSESLIQSLTSMIGTTRRQKDRPKGKETAERLSLLERSIDAANRNFTWINELEGDCREKLFNLQAADLPNERLRLEKLGARVFYVEEVERIVRNESDDIGYTVLFSKKELKNVLKMRKGKLIKFLKTKNFPFDLSSFDVNKARQFLNSHFENEMNNLKLSKTSLLAKELNVRGVIVEEFNIKKLAKKLKKQLKTEEIKEKNRLGEIERLRQNAFDPKIDNSQIKKALLQSVSSSLQKRLNCLGVTEILGDSIGGRDLTEKVKNLFFRLELFLTVIGQTRKDFTADFFAEGNMMRFLKNTKFKGFNKVILSDFIPFNRDDFNEIKKEQSIGILRSLKVPEAIISIAFPQIHRNILFDTLVFRFEEMFRTIIEKELNFLGVNAPRGDIKRLFRRFELVFLKSTGQ